MRTVAKQVVVKLNSNREGDAAPEALINYEPRASRFWKLFFHSLQELFAACCSSYHIVNFIYMLVLYMRFGARARGVLSSTQTERVVNDKYAFSTLDDLSMLKYAKVIQSECKK